MTTALAHLAPTLLGLALVVGVLIALISTAPTPPDREELARRYPDDILHDTDKDQP